MEREREKRERESERKQEREKERAFFLPTPGVFIINHIVQEKFTILKMTHSSIYLMHSDQRSQEWVGVTGGKIWNKVLQLWWIMDRNRDFAIDHNISL